MNPVNALFTLNRSFASWLCNCKLTMTGYTFSKPSWRIPSFSTGILPKKTRWKLRHISSHTMVLTSTLTCSLVMHNILTLCPSPPMANLFTFNKFQIWPSRPSKYDLYCEPLLIFATLSNNLSIRSSNSFHESLRLRSTVWPLH